MAKKGKLNKQQVFDIPKLLETMSMAQIARHYSVTVEAIYYWVRRLRAEGIKIKTRKPGSVSVIL